MYICRTACRLTQVGGVDVQCAISIVNSVWVGLAADQQRSAAKAALASDL